MISEFLMFLRYSAANGAPWEVAADMSMMQRLRLATVPELVAWDADAGRMMCSPSCFEMVMLVAFGNEGFRMPVPARMLGSVSSSAVCEVGSGCCLLSSNRFSWSVGMAGGVVYGVFDSVDAPAGAFLRDLKENFLGGSKELRMLCNFSDNPLIVCRY